jgi:hypothetical protein
MINLGKDMNIFRLLWTKLKGALQSLKGHGTDPEPVYKEPRNAIREEHQPEPTRKAILPRIEPPRVEQPHRRRRLIVGHAGQQATRKPLDKFMKHGHQAKWYRRTVKAKVRPEEPEDD